ncbi:hypothetical protein [Luteimonas sp. e5]
MNTRILLPALLALGLMACHDESPAPASDSTSMPAQTALGRKVQAAMEEARGKMLSENLELGKGFDIPGARSPGPSTLPKGEITPQGDFLIDGETVAVTPAQRRLLLEYRGHVIDIASHGMALGARGADLGMQAIGDVLKGLVTGNAEEIGKQYEAEAEKIKIEAKAVCKRLQPLLATQQALADTLQEFKPYASLTQADIDECMEQGGTELGGIADQVGESIEGNVRETVRSAVQAATARGITTHMGSGGSVKVDGIEFLLPAGSVSLESENDATRIHGEARTVELDARQMRIDARPYPRPPRGSQVDLRVRDEVRIDGAIAAPLP